MSSTDGTSQTSDETQETPDVEVRPDEDVAGTAPGSEPSARTPATAPDDTTQDDTTQDDTARDDTATRDGQPTSTDEKAGPTAPERPAPPVAAPAAVELPIILRTKPAAGAPGSGDDQTAAAPATAASSMLPPRAQTSPATPAAAPSQPSAPTQPSAPRQPSVPAQPAPSTPGSADLASRLSGSAAGAGPAAGEPTASSTAGQPSTTPAAPEPVREPEPARKPDQPSQNVPAATATSEQASPLEVFDGSDSPSRWPKVLLWSGLGLLIVAGAYLGAQWYFADRIPRGTTVAGVDIGGLGAEEATDLLAAELGGVASQPLPVTAGEGVGSLDPAAAGLRFDAEATVAELTQFTLDPRPLLAQISGGDEVDPVTVVDEALLDAATEALVVDLETPATSGTVGFVDGAAVRTDAVDGMSVDLESLRETVVDSWLTAARPLELETIPLEPEITQAETDAAFAEAQRVAAAPVSVAVAGQVAEIPVDDLTAAASYLPVDGGLTLTLDGPQLVDAVLDRTDDLLSNAADASFEFVDNVPTIQPGTPGTTLDPAVLATTVQAAALGDQRTATVELVASDPAQSTAALEALGIKEIVGEFATPLTNEPDRTQNLRIAAQKVTGTLVLPGETFSLIDTIGPITTGNGYLQAHVIVDGEITNGTGGGLSQMSTTTYNAGFFAGMVDVSHTPHSYWFSRYPEGRESTLYEGQIDMQWRNDSPYGVLLQSWVADGKLHVAAWSTKHYTVETTTSGRSNVVSPTTQHKAGPNCTPQSSGSPGFSVSVWRKVTVTGTGEVVVDETNTWRYKPQNAVVCDG